MRFHVVGGVLGGLLLITALSAKARMNRENGRNAYIQRNLVSDVPGLAEQTDLIPNLVNGWGIVFARNGFAWVADNGTGKATAYDGNGDLKKTITIPPAPGNPEHGTPTGVVFNDSDEFVITNGDASAPSRLIFATEDGAIAAWSPQVDEDNAIIAAVDDHCHEGAVFKGLAIAATKKGEFLYATDFHNAEVDVFDSEFKEVWLDGDFHDPEIPHGFAPFGIQNVNGDLYVTYAKQDPDAHDDVAGAGLGFVDVFSPDGHLIQRFASHGRLNAPWGIALAPADFGKFSSRLLVSNFGDGAINAFDLATGKPRGRLKRPDHRPLLIDGLWGISFGNGFGKDEHHQPINALFFAAGPDDESHGLFGRIEAATSCDDDDDDDDD